MGRTCCVYDCNTNYKSEVKRRKVEAEDVHVYRLPNPKKFPKQHDDWVSVLTKINANLNITNDTVVCSKHWPPNKPTFTHYGKERPVDPPSVFDKIPASIVPLPPPPNRRTFRSSCHEQNQQPDQLPVFEEIDRLRFSTTKECFVNRVERFSSSIPRSMRRGAHSSMTIL